MGVAVERNRDEDDSRRLHNVREKKPSSLAPSLPVTDKIRCAGKEKDLNVNDVNTPGQNVSFSSTLPLREFFGKIGNRIGRYQPEPVFLG